MRIGIFGAAGAWGWVALLLTGCSMLPSAGPLGREVVAEATAEEHIAFDVVPVDEAVVSVLQAHPEPGPRDRLKPYTPPPEIRIAVGDTLSVVIWESAGTGLFGTSLSEGAVLPRAAGRALGVAIPGGVSGGSAGGPGGSAGGGAAALPRPGAALDLQSVQQLVQSAAESGRAGTRIPDQAVGPDGAITIPYAGRIPVASRSPNEVERAIEKRLTGKALDPQAVVVVQRSVANSVTVSGEGVSGARIPLGPGGSRLLEVIAAASGPNAPVHETFVRLSRDGVTATVPLARLVADPAQNIYAAPGDVLTLVRRPQTFSAFGATGKNAAITFEAEHLSLTEALAKAGGLLDERADPRSVFLFRYEPVALVRALGQPVATNAPGDVSPVVYRLDLRQAKSYGLARQIAVRDKDIIFVANAEVMPLYKFFSLLNTVAGPIGGGIVAGAQTAATGNATAAAGVAATANSATTGAAAASAAAPSPAR